MIINLLVGNSRAIFSPETYGAKGDGIADDTVPVLRAFAAANALARPGLVSTILHPGATVALRGTYNLASLTAAVEARCNVLSLGAAFLIPAAYADVAVLIGHSGNGYLLQAAQFSMPDIVKPTGSTIVAGSVGTRIQNLFNSEIHFARTDYFETGMHYTGWNNGAAYNSVFIGWISYCKIAILLKPHLAGGYANQNFFYSGGIQQSPGFAGGNKVVGWRHLVMDGNNISNITGNSFENVSFEGDVSEYVFELRGAYDNVFHACRHEQGVAGIACTVAGGGTATITKVAHGLSVGDMLTFSASVAPTGMFLIVPYFVTSVPTADTFTISAQKGGTSVNFATSGTAVIYFRPQRILIDGQTQLVSNNTIQYPMTPLRAIDVINLGSQVTNNMVQWTDRSTMDSFVDTDQPMYRARNRSGTATSAPLWAAYASGVNPVEDPYNWTTSLSARGILFAAARAETSRFYESSGILQYRRVLDTKAYEVPSARRSPSLITSIVALSCLALTTTTTTVTLTDAAVNDHVLVTPVSGMPAGIFLSHAYVSSADTITVVFGNLTAAPIAITPVLQAIAIRRFY